MKSTLFKLNSNDFIKGLIVAVLGAVFTSLAQMLDVPGFDLATFDWQLVLNVAVTAALSYLSKNLLSDENDKVLGAI